MFSRGGVPTDAFLFSSGGRSISWRGRADKWEGVHERQKGPRDGPGRCGCLDVDGAPCMIGSGAIIFGFSTILSPILGSIPRHILLARPSAFFLQAASSHPSVGRYFGRQRGNMARPVAVWRAGCAQRMAYGSACYLSRLPGFRRLVNGESTCWFYSASEILPGTETAWRGSSAIAPAFSYRVGRGKGS